MSLTNSPFWMANPGGGFYDYEIENSFRLDSSSNHNLSRTPASAGNRQTWTLSFWWKRAKILNGQALFGWGNTNQNTVFAIATYAGNSTWDIYDYNNGTDRMAVSWSNKVRDPAAWYHIVLRIDTTQATASNRVRLYINGEAADSSGGRSSYPSQNLSLFANNNTTAYVGRDPYNTNGEGYYADVNFIDGQSLDPTSFAETKSGVWVPKEYTGSYGTNGYFLKFQNSAALGTDSSGNSNNFTVYNASSIDQMPDTPTNNFNTFSSVVRFNSGSLSEGSLKSSSVVGGASNQGPCSTYNVKSGKWYFEFRITGGSEPRSIYAGAAVARVDNSLRPGRYVAAVYDGGIYNINGSLHQGGLALPATNDVFGFATDMDNSTCQVYRNGSTYGTQLDFSGSSLADTGFMGFMHNHGSSSTNSTVVVNYGQDSTFAGATTAGGNADDNGYGDFKYAPPSGFLAMCSQNLPAPAIDPLDDATPEDYFNTLLYTGANPNAAQSVTGVGFQPDFVWIKSRVTGYGHALQDVVRGATGRLQSDTTGSESVSSTYVSSFDSDGFSLGVDYGQNAPSEPYVAWNWKAGGTGVSNTDGSITSTVSANQDAGFSIVTYTGNGTAGATVGHGLGKKPTMIIVKNRDDGAQDWPVQHGYIGATGQMVLSSAAANNTSSVYWNNTEPTSSVFSLGTANNTNQSGDSHVAYCFTDIDGYSKTGSYTGNGSADGAFIYTGFRPAWVLIKRSDSSGSWHIIDDKRIGYNDSNRVLIPDISSGEQTNYSVQERDILSNGFKMRDSNSGTNASGGTYIYLAFAQSPFKYANAR